MNIKEQQKEVQDFVLSYAIALNNADKKLIAGFYATDGILMPNGHSTLSQSQLLKNSGDDFFKNVKFHIEYQIADVAIAGNLALVSAMALTKSTDLRSNVYIEKMSRDLFVCSLEGGHWKILRYMFNNQLI